jgi:hypothetical protein
MVRRAKIGEPTRFFLNFPLLLFNKYKQECGAAEKRVGNYYIFVGSRCTILPCLLLVDGLIAKIFIAPSQQEHLSIRYHLLVGQFPVAFQYPLRSAQEANQ